MVAYCIIIMCLVNIVRMASYLISSDYYTWRQSRHQRRNRRSPKTAAYLPTMTVLVPAHNESATIHQTIHSLQGSRYPKSKLRIIIINDGSTDNTATTVRRLVRQYKGGFNTRLINQKNMGKAAALNNALKRYVTSTLVMCLDADSLVEPDMLRRAAAYFKDRSVVALASNVNIIENNTLMGLAQRFEYLICYQMKKAQTVLNIEYIIGGIGSVFRHRNMEQVHYYDTNTMTEDIDLTMKLLSSGGNRQQKIIYGADCITYTQPVTTLRSLMRQRFRWKYGRLQTFLKHRDAFFSNDKKYVRHLTYFFLPFSLVQEIIFFFEPLVVFAVMAASLRYHDPRTLLSAFMVISIYVSLNVWASEHLSIKERLRLTYYAPAMYLLLYVLSIAEYTALLKSAIKLPKLRSSIQAGHTTWQSPDRSTTAKA